MPHKAFLSVDDEQTVLKFRTRNNKICYLKTPRLQRIPIAKRLL